MTRKEINTNYLFAVFFYLLFIILAHSVYLNASIHNSNKSEGTTHQIREKIKDPAEKQKIYNQIKKDIMGLSLEECIRYIDWSPLIQSYYPDSSIFAIEAILKKWGEKVEEIPYFFNRLAYEYLLKNEFNKSEDTYKDAYFSMKHINKEERKKTNNKRNAELYALNMMLKKNDNNSMKFVNDKTKKFIQENINLTYEQMKEANRIITICDNISLKLSESEKVMSLAQQFLNNMAIYINNKDIKGFSAFFKENMEDKEMAKIYSDIGIKKFFRLKSIKFKVLSISAEKNIYDVYYEWITEPKNAIPYESNSATHPEFTFKYDGKKLIFVD